MGSCGWGSFYSRKGRKGREGVGSGEWGVVIRKKWGEVTIQRLDKDS